MTEHEYKTKIEELDSQIRAENYKGKQHDVVKARHDVSIKESQAKQHGIKAKISSQQVRTEQQHLIQARHDTSIAKLTVQMREQDVRQLERENPVRQKLLDMKFEGLMTDTSTARKLLDQRKYYLKQQDSI